MAALVVVMVSDGDVLQVLGGNQGEGRQPKVIVSRHEQMMPNRP